MKSSIPVCFIFVSKVNIVPIIAKADSLTAEECQRFKQQVLVLASLAEIRHIKDKGLIVLKMVLHGKPFETLTGYFYF